MFPREVRRLLERFLDNRTAYEAPSYLEASVRQDFLDPFFRALGWDVGNESGRAEHLREVVVESRLRAAGRNTAPDYAFRAGSLNKFFVEAKKPSVNIARDTPPALQVRNYGWNAGVPFCILTDFAEFSVYDTRILPSNLDGPENARLHYIRCEDYESEWEWIEDRFSRESVLNGRYDALATEERIAHKTQPVDTLFLTQIEHWRELLAKDLARKNPALREDELSWAVQVILDRIIFLRICEDRGIEPERRLRDAVEQEDAYGQLQGLFDLADLRYNSGLFHLRRESGRASHRDELTPTLSVSNEALRSIVGDMYWPVSPFNFHLIGPEVLGNVYEQFLGKVILLDSRRTVQIEEKPEVKNAGGVVYTPESVVKYIVDASLGKVLEGKSILQVAGRNRARDAHPIRIADPACGSGSFLIAVYQKLLDWHLEKYIDDAATWSRGRDARIFRAEDSTWRLTTGERRRILTTHVFGVDIDAQAVEVAKLSLLLKVLENESAASLDSQLALLHERALPDLDRNIKCGNSLVGSDIHRTLQSGQSAAALNAFDWDREFPAIFNANKPGFDVVVGNPPYVLLQAKFRDSVTEPYLRTKYEVAAFKMDLYHLFLERSLGLTRPGGICGLITPSNYLTNNYADKIRSFLINKSSVAQIAIVDKAVFPKRSVDCAIIVAKAGVPTEDELIIRKVIPGIHQSLRIVSETSLDPERVRASNGYLFTGGGRASDEALLDGIQSQGTRLRELASVNFGKQLRNRKLFLDDVIEVPSLAKVPSTHRPCYTGRDVNPWSVWWSGLACLDDPIARSGGCWDPRWQNATNKLLCRQVGPYPFFALDEAGHQCLNTMFMVNLTCDGMDPWHVLGVLNSLPIRALWVDRYWDRRRTFPKIKGTYLKELPIPEATNGRVAVLAKGLAATTRDIEGATTQPQKDALARQINQAQRQLDREVASLFGLGDNDIATLEELVQTALAVAD